MDRIDMEGHPGRTGAPRLPARCITGFRATARANVCGERPLPDDRRGRFSTEREEEVVVYDGFRMKT